LKLEPVVTGNLSYFEAPAPAFVKPDGSESNFAFDVQDFDIFKEKDFSDRIQRVDFFYEITNTINRAFTGDVILMDDNNTSLYIMHFDVPAYSGTENIITRTEIFDGTKLDLLKSSTKMAFSVAMAAGPALNQNSPGSLILRSTATIYFIVE